MDHRIFVRVGLVAAVAIALAVAFAALRELGGLSPAAWAALAAALAICASAISAFNGQRLLEMQEDAAKPRLQLEIDSQSRYGLVQLRLTNKGQSTAYDISVQWKEPAPLGPQKKPVVFGRDGKLPILNSGESASLMLGGSHEYFGRDLTDVYTAQVRFTDKNGKTYDETLAFSSLRDWGALYHQDEYGKTLYDLQQLADSVEKIHQLLLRDRTS